MADRNEASQETVGDPPPPGEADDKALPPGVWVTGLIALVLLLLAAFGLR